MTRRLPISAVFIFLVHSVIAQVDSTGTFPDTINYKTNSPPEIVDTVPAKTVSPDTLQVKMQAVKPAKVYRLHAASDIPIIAAGTGWSVYAFTKIYSKGSIAEEKILALDKNDINSFDRWAVMPYSESLDKFSYYPFYAAIPLPLAFFLAEKKMQKDYGTLICLYLEAMSVTGLFGTGATYFVDRYRPYTYNAETPMEKRTGENAKNSFYAGHVEIIAVSTFFIAKVYNDYHPESKSRWVYFAAASAATAGMGYLRLQGGMHFPSDILLGAATGALAGILVPQFHKTGSDNSMSLLPFKTRDATGVYFAFKF